MNFVLVRDKIVLHRGFSELFSLLACGRRNVWLDTMSVGSIWTILSFGSTTIIPFSSTKYSGSWDRKNHHRLEMRISLARIESESGSNT